MAYHRRATMISPELEQQWSSEDPPDANPNSDPESQLKPLATINFPKLAPSVSIKKRKNKKKNRHYVTAINSDDAWPDPIPLPEFPSQVSVEEQEKLAAIQLQKKSIIASQVFFSRNEEDEDEGEEMEFFLGIFKEDDELRNFYEKNWESGEFSCLVCGGIGEKVRKRFKNCGALVQHSLTIAMTKGRRAHRAYGKVICQVLGWNPDTFPSITKGASASASVFPNGNPEMQENNKKAVAVGEEQNGILSNQVHCLMELDMGCQTESSLSPELEVIPLSSTNTDLVPVTPVTDVDVLPHQTEIIVPKPGSLTSVPYVEAVSNAQPKISVSKPQSLAPLPGKELEKYAAIHLQRNKILACQTFFSSNKERIEDEAIEFFIGLFKENNNELKSYYENNSHNGEFYCLVCDGIGNKKVGKRFKNCVALVQHSLTISNCNGRIAHRAFGKAICQVLGWNTNTHGRLLVKVDSGASVQGEQGNADNHCEVAANQEMSLVPNIITKTIDTKCNNVRVVLNLCPLNSSDQNSFKLVNFSVES